MSTGGLGKGTLLFYLFTESFIGWHGGVKYADMTGYSNTRVAVLMI